MDYAVFVVFVVVVVVVGVVVVAAPLHAVICSIHSVL